MEINHLNFDFSDGILREHNKDVYRKVVYGLMKNNSVLFEQATGTGKSYVAMKFLHNFGNGKRVIYVTPNKPISTQFKNDIISMNSFIQARNIEDGTNTPLIDCQLDTCLYQGLPSKLEEQYDIIIFDEVHRMGAKTWGPNAGALMKNNPNAKIIGMTATMERPDGVDIKQYFGDREPVSRLTLTDALQQGILPYPNYTLGIVDFGQDEEFL